MNIFKKIYCRIFQDAFHLAIPVLPYRNPEILKSCGEVGNLLLKNKIDNVLIVTDEFLHASGLADK